MDIDAILDADGELYRIWFPGTGLSFSFRLLSLKEYKTFKSVRDGGLMPPFLVSENIFERCYLGNTSLISENAPAGVTITIGNLIMWLSGDCDTETLSDDIVRSRALHPPDTVFEYMRSAIISVFSNTTVKEMESWSRARFIRIFTIAENVLGKQNPEYEKLNVKEIRQPGSEPATPEHDIDFRSENRAIGQAMGPWAYENMEDEGVSSSGKQLTRTQLQKLSNR